MVDAGARGGGLGALEQGFEISKFPIKDEPEADVWAVE